MSQLTKEEIERYSRHLSLQEFGATAQEKLKAARILVIGAGGLSCPALQYLAASGVGVLGVIDDDVVEVSNLQRQILYGSSDIGERKVDVVASCLSNLNPFVRVETHFTRLSVENALDLIDRYDLVIDGSDNFATRYLVNDACVVSGKAFVAASIFKFEGQISVYNGIGVEGERSPTYRCLFPEPPDSAVAPPCGQIGVLGVVPGVLGTLQATEAIKYLTGIGDVLLGELLVLDLLQGSFQRVTFYRNEELAHATRLLSPEDYLSLCGYSESEGENVGSQNSTVRELSVSALKQSMDSGGPVVLIDVREPFERDIASIGGNLIPLGELRERVAEVPREGQVIIYCRSGGRSAEAVSFLQQEHGYSNLVNLTGGILAWAATIDRSMPTY